MLSIVIKSIKSLLLFTILLLTILLLLFKLITLRPKPGNIKGVVIPHHLVAIDLIKETLGKIDYPPKLIILFAPNHYEVGNKPITLDSPLFVNTTISQPIDINPQLFQKEHAVNDLKPLISQYFPHTPIVSVMLSNYLTEDDSAFFAKSLTDSFNSNSVLLIATVDFSHYLPTDIADQKDAETLSLITSKNYQLLRKLGNDNLDSPATLVTFLSQMDAVGATCNPLHHQNSNRILGTKVSSTTSYYTFLCR